MPIVPKIPTAQTNTAAKRCEKCGALRALDTDFTFTHSKFYQDSHLPICNHCITEMLREHDFEWEFIDKICQWADIPFIVKEWDRLRELNTEDTIWGTYAKVFAGQEYENLGWGSYDKQYRKLREVGLIEEEIPEVREQKYIDLRRKWGANYDDDELNYLEQLYKGLLISQNVNGALQVDQAQKICKISLEIDSRIRAGDKDVDKFLSSYDKLVKTAEFTPKNTKNAVDFDSFAEVAFWLEKRGRQNKYYDGTTRDIIDETLHNIQNYNRKLYYNEGGIGEEITERVEALRDIGTQEENVYGTETEVNLDEYDNEAYNFEETDEFKVDIDINEGDE